MTNENVERRLVRIESRLVQIMLHLGIDPYERMYEKLQSDEHSRTARPTTQSRGSTASTAKPSTV